MIALQDIATDALTIDVVPLDEQARANGLMSGGRVLGVAGTAAAAAYLFGAAGVSATFALAALVTLAFAGIPLVVRERPGERLLPWTAGAPSPEAQALQLHGWAAIGRSLRRVAFLPASVLMLGVSFLVAGTEGFFDAFGPVFTVQSLGWSDGAFSNAKAVAELVGGVVGMVGGGNPRHERRAVVTPIRHDGLGRNPLDQCRSLPDVGGLTRRDDETYRGNVPGCRARPPRGVASSSGRLGCARAHWRRLPFLTGRVLVRPLSTRPRSSRFRVTSGGYSEARLVLASRASA